MKQRILLVGDYNRSDFLHLAKLFHSEIDFFFIEFVNQYFLKNKECLKYGQVLYWKNYKHAYDLLNKIRPEKVIFYFIESYNHVALNVAAKTYGIHTYHLEHGLRFKIDVRIKEMSYLERFFDKIKKIAQLQYLYDRYASRMFFRRTVKDSSKQEKEFLNFYYSVRKGNSIHATFEKIKNPLRLPDWYISFSPIIFSFHKLIEKLPDNYPVYFTGIPFFDHFAKWKTLKGHGENVLFIDQPLVEQKLMGWTIKYKWVFVMELITIIHALGKKLYIKPHPWNDKSIYETLSGNVIVLEDEWETVVPNINTVLGFSSTLLMPFMAMDHITCFTLEMHQWKLEMPYSIFLLKSGACHAVNDFEGLSQKLNELEKWHVKQTHFKEQFIKDYMYKFDGNSSRRLKNILLDEVH